MTGQNDRQDRKLTGQVRDPAGHCPLTGRYSQPWAQENNNLDVKLLTKLLFLIINTNHFSIIS